MKLNLIDVRQEIVALLNKIDADGVRYTRGTRQTAAELIHLLDSGKVVLTEPKAATESNETLVKRIADLERQLSSAHAQLDNLLEDNQKLMVIKAELEGDVRRLYADHNTSLKTWNGVLTDFIGFADNGRVAVYSQNGKLKTLVKSAWTVDTAHKDVSFKEAGQRLVERIDAANKVIYTNMPTSDKSDTEVLREVIGHLYNADIVLLMNALRAKDGGL